MSGYPPAILTFIQNKFSLSSRPSDTIVAIATAQGPAAIALLRISGPNALKIIDQCFFNLKKKKIDTASILPRKSVFGIIVRGEEILDEVLLVWFKAPNSYTGEDLVEISCHGSAYIQQQLLNYFLVLGARMAEPGEFTMRAFLNGRMDLSQAEAVSDLINSNSSASHHLAMNQMRGGFSNKIKDLREGLIHFASLIELELDFSEEDVEFADRSALLGHVNKIQTAITHLLNSFALGNVLKNGIPVTIIGKPNAGKSTLLNALLNEERAIVSDIAGTTRDTIEDLLTINGIVFRFIDTAGLRETEDVIEKIGVEKTWSAVSKAAAVIYLFDAGQTTQTELDEAIAELKTHSGSAQIISVANKADLINTENKSSTFSNSEQIIFISAKEKQGLDALKDRLLALYNIKQLKSDEVIVTNARHAASLALAGTALQKVSEGLQSQIPGDLLALDIRFALEQLGNITGQVTNEDLLTNIFTRFCIGK